MCASERYFGWGRKPCSALYLKRLPKPAKANTYRYPIMSIELVAEALFVLGTVEDLLYVMEASETSAAAVSISAFRGEDVMVEGSGVGLDLAEEGRQ